MSVEKAQTQPRFKDLPWVKELDSIRHARQQNLDIAIAKAAEHGETVAPEEVSLKPVPFDHIWAFAKGVRERPELWGPCIVEAERRKNELMDPNSELRQEEWVQEDTDPETYILDFGRVAAFKEWFMSKNGYFGKESPFAYYWANMIMRGWNRGDLSEVYQGPARELVERFTRVSNDPSIIV